MKEPKRSSYGVSCRRLLFVASFSFSFSFSMAISISISISMAMAMAMASIGYGQQVSPSISRGPYYAGEPVTFQVVVKGFEEEPQPEVKQLGDLDPALKFQLAEVSPSVSSFTQIINGQVTRSRTVSFVYRFQIRVDKAGQYTVGPFEVSQNSTVRRIEAFQIEFEEIAVSDTMKIEVGLPSRTYYVGEKIPITLRRLYTGKQGSVQNLVLRSPVFDQFSFEDPQPNQRDTYFVVQSSAEMVGVKATVTNRRIDGQTVQQWEGVRWLLADRAGTFPLQVSGNYREVTRWVQDFFSRRPAESTPYLVRSEEVSLVIRPLPQTGRPESFAGAVGKSFHVDVTADRTVVRVGDPISLNVTVHGDGNLEKTGLPPLSADGGLADGQFRLPPNEPTGTYSDGIKQFKVSVRVADESVVEIPAIAYSWFDPQLESYQTARSDPIALRVMPAVTISSSDVVSSATRANGNDEGEGSGVATNQGNPKVGNLARGAVAFEGADLSIETNVTQLLAQSTGLFNATTISYVIYALGVLLVGWTLVDQKRRNVDPPTVGRRVLFGELKKSISAAKSLPNKEALEEIANALRKAVAASGDQTRSVGESLLAEYEAMLFAPQNDGGSIDHRLAEKALAAVEAMAKDESCRV